MPLSANGCQWVPLSVPLCERGAMQGGGKGGKKGGKDGDDGAAMAKRLAEMEMRHAKEMEEAERRMNELIGKLMDPNLSDADRRALLDGEKERQAKANGERQAKLEAMEKAAKGGKVCG